MFDMHFFTTSYNDTGAMPRTNIATTQQALDWSADVRLRVHQRKTDRHRCQQALDRRHVPDRVQCHEASSLPRCTAVE
jgi:hypothetical protein